MLVFLVIVVLLSTENSKQRTETQVADPHLYALFDLLF
jgi:hypothetical protein